MGRIHLHLLADAVVVCGAAIFRSLTLGVAGGLLILLLLRLLRLDQRRCAGLLTLSVRTTARIESRLVIANLGVFINLRLLFLAPNLHLAICSALLGGRRECKLISSWLLRLLGPAARLFIELAGA